MYKSSHHDQVEKEQLYMDEIKIELNIMKERNSWYSSKNYGFKCNKSGVKYHFPLQFFFRAVKTNLTADLTVIYSLVSWNIFWRENRCSKAKIHSTSTLGVDSSKFVVYIKAIKAMSFLMKIISSFIVLLLSVSIGPINEYINEPINEYIRFLFVKPSLSFNFPLTEAELL